jgi:hypothetical protein
MAQNNIDAMLGWWLMEGCRNKMWLWEGID